MQESQNIEWKETWRDEHLKWVSAFANAEGGRLMIGRDDSGRVKHLADAKRLLEELPNKIRDLLGLVVPVNLHTEAAAQWIEIVVEAVSNPVSYRGEYHVRSGSTKQQLRGAALDAFLLRKHGLTWDGVPMPGVSVDDLSAEALQIFRRKAIYSKRVPETVAEESDQLLLERLQLTTGSYLKRAAVLLFHPAPERFVTNAWTKIGFFNTDADLRYQDEIHGPLTLQIDAIVERLDTKYLKRVISYEGMQRVETLQVPEPALREALANAIVHKDYASYNTIQISVYPDRLMIWNPGQLPPTWDLERLLGKHSSVPHNPDVARIFFRSGQIEAWGRGIQRIQEACRDAGAKLPIITVEATGVWVEFELLPTGAAGGQVGVQVGGQVTPLVEEQIKLLQVIKDESSREEIQERLGLSARRSFVKRFLAPALEAGLIEMTIPDKPTSRLQRYRLTQSGVQKLAQHSG